MKKFLSLVIASTLCLGACATPASAEFTVNYRTRRHADWCIISWTGMEPNSELVVLRKRLRRWKLVSRSVSGELVARNSGFGDRHNTICIPAAATLKVKQKFVSGRAGEMTFNPYANELVPACCKNASVGMTALFCDGQLRFSEDIGRQYDPGYRKWFLRSW